MSAMERSRQTIFVLSENFVRSDWCRYELDFSHFWIFEGNTGGEPAILILLEPLSKDDIPKRFCKLRKLMSSTTYLEWPQEEDKMEEFWQRLHNALQSGEDDDWGKERQYNSKNEFVRATMYDIPQKIQNYFHYFNFNMKNTIESSKLQKDDVLQWCRKIKELFFSNLWSVNLF